VSLNSELLALPELRDIGSALVQFIEALHPGGDFSLKGRRWVYDPNFVTLTVQSARAKNIVISLRGKPDEFPQDRDPPLRTDQHGYSACTLDSARQLAAVTSYIERAYEIWARGRSRAPTTPVVYERPT
jgi:hypothetical protein